MYFPDYPKSRQPQRKYLLNVVNTVSKGSVIKAIESVRRSRILINKEGPTVEMNEEMFKNFSEFENFDKDF